MREKAAYTFKTIKPAEFILKRSLEAKIQFFPARLTRLPGPMTSHHNLVPGESPGNEVVISLYFRQMSARKIL